MLATPHLLVGALIGRLAGSYPLALPLAFASHFLLDVIPHTDQLAFTREDEITRGKVISWLIDAGLGAGLIFFLADGNQMMISTALVALFPDLVDNFPLWNVWLRRQVWYAWFGRLHDFFDGGVTVEDSSAKKFLGILTQFIVGGAALWFIMR
jgi:hypothetical protein